MTGLGSGRHEMSPLQIGWARGMSRRWLCRAQSQSMKGKAGGLGPIEHHGQESDGPGSAPTLTLRLRATTSQLSHLSEP